MAGIPDCSECIYYDESPMDDPCYHCLDGYVGRPNFKRKAKEVKKEKTKKKQEKSADKPLPWS